MGMSIDNAKKWLKLAVPIKALTEEEFATFIQAVNLAVDTMGKYQKIEEIITDWKSDGGTFEMLESYWLRLISEVVEDGGCPLVEIKENKDGKID